MEEELITLKRTRSSIKGQITKIYNYLQNIKNVSEYEHNIRLSAIQKCEEGIITKIDNAEWGTPVVPIVKPNGSIRLCADYKVTLNKMIKDEQYPIPIYIKPRRIPYALKDLVDNEINRLCTFPFRF